MRALVPLVIALGLAGVSGASQPGAWEQEKYYVSGNLATSWSACIDDVGIQAACFVPPPGAASVRLVVDDLSPASVVGKYLYEHPGGWAQGWFCDAVELDLPAGAGLVHVFLYNDLPGCHGLASLTLGGSVRASFAP